MSENQEVVEQKDKKETKENALNAKVRVMESKLNAVVNALESAFGMDLNKDGKIASLLVALALSASAALAVSPSTNTAWNLSNQNGTNDYFQIQKNGDVKTDGAITATAVIASGDIAGQSLSLTGSNSVQYVAKATYDPVAMGGTTNANISLGVSIPSGAVIRDAYIFVSEAFEPATPYMSVGVGDSVVNLLASDRVTNSFKAGYTQCIPDWATVGDALRTNGLIKVKPNTATITNGTCDIVVIYDIVR